MSGGFLLQRDIKSVRKRKQWIPKRCQTLKAEPSFIDDFAAFTLSHSSGEPSTISQTQQWAAVAAKVTKVGKIPAAFKKLQVQK